MSSRLSLKLSSLLLLGAVGLTTNLPAEENHWEWGPQATGKATIAPKRLVDLHRIAPAQTLSAADDKLLRVISDWNLAGNLPVRNGIERPLPESHLVLLPTIVVPSQPQYHARGILVPSVDGRTVSWAFAVRVDKAWRLRLRLDAVRLPAESKLWVYGEGDEAVGPFGTELIGPDGTLWTPSVRGPEIRLEIVVRTASSSDVEPRLRVTGVAELFRLTTGGIPELKGDAKSEDTSCLQDAKCVGTNILPSIDAVRKAVAYLEFMKDGVSGSCTGTLIADKDQSTAIPYLLTANHCFSTQSAASSLEAFFDYAATTCGGLPPSPGDLPRATGASLLKTSAINDFTFVRLNRLPPGRALLGWTTAEPPGGSFYHRISHPLGLWEAYSGSGKDPNPAGGTCGEPLSNYHFSTPLIGGTFVGSSGSAVLNDNAQVLGQLKGQCGPVPAEGCNYENHQYDGKFGVTFPQISQYINVEGGGGGGGTGSCTNNLTNGVVCLRSGRFEFTGTWTDFANPANTKPLIWTPVEDINATGGFQNNPSGIQVVMRVADGCSQTGAYWVWLGGFTDAGWSIRVRDTVTGRQKTFNRTRQSGAFPATLRDATTFTCN